MAKGWGALASSAGYLWYVQNNIYLSPLKPKFPPKQIVDAKENKSRASWVNFKQAIWHESFYKLLESIEAHSMTGCWVNCGDGIVWNIFPLILILAADFEEQWVIL